MSDMKEIWSGMSSDLQCKHASIHGTVNYKKIGDWVTYFT